MTEEKTLKQKTASGLFWGTVNSFLTQLLSLAIGIILGRLLSPAEYGLIGMLAIFSAIAGTLQESGFRAALTNLKDVSHREYNAVFWFSTSVSLSLYVILFFCAPLIADFYHQPELIGLSRLTFASFVAAGIGTAHSAYMFRNMMNKEKAVVGFVSLSVSGVAGIVLALLGYSYWSLAWQTFIFILTCDIMTLYYVRWLPTLPVDFTPIKKMFGFSSKILLTNIINQVNNNILSLIFGRLYSSQDVGNYTQASKWNVMGHSLITGSIGQVAQPVLVSVTEKGNRQINIFRKMLRFVSFVSMPAMLGLSLIADFVPLLLGEQWNNAVILLRILCISGAFMPIHSLYQNLFISNGRSDTYMWCTLAQVVLQITVVLGFSGSGINIMVTAYTIMIILWLAVLQFLARRMTGLRTSYVIKDVMPFLLVTLFSIGVAWYLTGNIVNAWLSIILRIIITTILYLGILRLLGARILAECLQFIAKRGDTQ